jgi:hypothetical protein
VIVFAKHDFSEGTSSQNFKQLELFERANVTSVVLTLENQFGFRFGLL